MQLPPFISEIIARKKAGFDRIQPDRFHIRLARTVEEYKLAFRLVQLSFSRPMRTGTSPFEHVLQCRSRQTCHDIDGALS